jgi:hypothetical protein
MICIIASRGKRGAVIERDSKFYYSLGPALVDEVMDRSPWFTPMSLNEVEIYKKAKKYIVHEPPTEIESLKDWPTAAVAYEEKAKQLVSSGSAAD